MTTLPVASRTLAASPAVAVIGLLGTVGCAWRLTAVGGAHEIVWLNLTVAAIVGGFLALGWLRPTRVGVTAPQLMLMLGAAGMTGGLACDAHSGGFAALVSVCLAGGGNFGETLRLHWHQLPAMHLGMIAGGLATVPLLRNLRKECRRQFCARLVQNLACSAWMVVGMTAGTLFFIRIAALVGGRSPAAMLGGMFGGMVWGMVASVSMYRLWYWIIARPTDAARGR